MTRNPMEWASIIFRVLRADSGHGDSSSAERRARSCLCLGTILGSHSFPMINNQGIRSMDDQGGRTVETAIEAPGGFLTARY
jgi:hypothetical protein